MEVRRVGFIGGGVIAEALATGLVEKGGIKKDDILISEQSASRREYLAKGDWKVTSENKDTAEFDVIFISLKQDEVAQVHTGLFSRLYRYSIARIIDLLNCSCVSSGAEEAWKHNFNSRLAGCGGYSEDTGSEQSMEVSTSYYELERSKWERRYRHLLERDQVKR